MFAQFLCFLANAQKTNIRNSEKVYNISETSPSLVYGFTRIETAWVSQRNDVARRAWSRLWCFSTSKTYFPVAGIARSSHLRSSCHVTVSVQAVRTHPSKYPSRYKTIVSTSFSCSHLSNWSSIIGLAGMACRVGYSDFHNLMGFTSKKMPYNIL